MWGRGMRTMLQFVATAMVATLLCQGAIAQSAPCRQVNHDRDAYTICEVDLRKSAVRLYWRRPDGSPYGYLQSLPRSLGSKTDELLFATNAGMFDPSFRPVGLYVEQGHELVRANTQSGYGKFHMKPNGVFYIKGDMAGVLETGAYLKQRPKVDFATQSGPMLVLNGRLHPKFDRATTSLKMRNGVGVRSPSSLVFAISKSEVSFEAFARLFRDTLHCSDALFLDGGSASSLYVPSIRVGGNILPLGPMLGVFAKPAR